MDKNDVVDVLNNLIETSKDGEYGFRTSAEHAQADTLRTLLLRRADQCRQAVIELEAMVRHYGGSADEHGSVSGALHRGWVAVKTTLTTYDDKAILEECERGEDVAKARYRKALEQTLPPDVQALVQRQYEGVQRNHDEVKTLRNQARATG
jgi:uncharacterized protein (TIGR02284 family)